MPNAGLAHVSQLSTVCNESNYITDFGGHTSNNLVEIQNPTFSIFGIFFSLSLLKLTTKTGAVYITHSPETSPQKEDNGLHIESQVCVVSRSRALTISKKPLDFAQKMVFTGSKSFSLPGYPSNKATGRFRWNLDGPQMQQTKLIQGLVYLCPPACFFLVSFFQLYFA